MTATHNAGRNPASNSVRKLLSCIFVFLVWGFAGVHANPAQTSTVDKPSETSKATSPAPSAGASEAPPKPSDEVIALRAQLELMHQYDQRLLSTVYWSLTVVVALVLALITIIGFLNLRVYERDKAALKQELVGLITQQLAESQRTLGNEISAFQHNIQKILDESRESITSLSRETAESLVNQLRGQVLSLEREVADLRFDLAEGKASEWKSKGVYSNALSANLQMLKIATERGYGWRLGNLLEDMQHSLKAIIAQGSRLLGADLGREISEGMSLLPNTYAIEIGIINDLVQKARS